MVDLIACLCQCVHACGHACVYMGVCMCVYVILRIHVRVCVMCVHVYACAIIPMLNAITTKSRCKKGSDKGPVSVNKGFYNVPRFVTVDFLLRNKCTIRPIQSLQFH